MRRFYDWVVNNRYRILAVIFWFAVWQGMSMWIDKEIFLPSPFHVVQCLGQLVMTAEFWKTIGGSVAKILAGFLLAVLCGTLLAAVTFRFHLLREIITLGMQVIKSIPVASFVILSLLWVKAENLSLLMAFLMVLPIIYTNTLEGIRSTDPKLNEMAKVFKMNGVRKIKYIYVPAVIPYFVSGVTIGLGFCWKSGVAAEVISIARHSIGGKLYEAKIYLNTRELFAWTIVIVVISVIFEKAVIFILRKTTRWITKE